MMKGSWMHRPWKSFRALLMIARACNADPVISRVGTCQLGDPERRHGRWLAHDDRAVPSRLGHGSRAMIALLLAIPLTAIESVATPVAGPVASSRFVADANGDVRLFPWSLPASESISVGPWNLCPENPVPAGAEGRITVDAAGRLSVGGRRIRLYGVNTMKLPDNDAEAVREAALIAAWGFNAVRFHGMDSAEFLDSTTFFDRFDRYFAELKNRGIWSNWNWIVKAPLRPSDGFPASLQDVLFKVRHVLFFFDPQAQAWQRDLARRFFTHRNRITGLTYAEDPALSIVEVINEHGLINSWHDGKIEALPIQYRGQLVDLWRSWLQQRYPTLDSLRAAWADEGADFDRLELPSQAGRTSMPTRKIADWLVFLESTEASYHRQMLRFLRDDLGVRSLSVAGIAQNTTPGIAAVHDLVDVHEYWNHLIVAESGSGSGHMRAGAWYVRDNSFVAGAARKFPFMGRFRIAGKPFLVTEYHDCPSIPTGGHGVLAYAAYAALQDWDGLFLFTWHGSGSEVIRHTFEVRNQPTVQGLARLSSLIFRDGLVSPARDVILLPHSPDANVDRLLKGVAWNIAPVPTAGPAGGLVHRVAVDLHGGAPLPDRAPLSLSGPLASDTGELHWLQSGQPRLTIAAPRVMSFTGAVPAVLDVGGLRIECDASIDGEATVALVITDGTGLMDARRALLVTAGRSQNTGQTWGVHMGAASAKDRAAGKPVTTVTNWGGPPVLTERISALLSLPAQPGRILRVQALDQSGRMSGDVPVEAVNGRESFRVGGTASMAWYLSWSMSDGELR